jgi:hypothetical protein
MAMRTISAIGRAMRRALQWRLLVLSPVVLWAAAIATLIPLLGFLGGLFDHSPRWRELGASLDSTALAGLAKATMTPAAAGLSAGIGASFLLAALLAPLLAGAALVVAEAEARPRFRALLAGAAGYYGRMLRLQIAALLPVGLALIIATLAMGWASGVSDRVTSEAATHTSHRIAVLIAALAVFLAQLVADAGRARLAVEAHRRSALFALGAGVKLVVKRPVAVLAVGLSASLASLVVAAALLVIRQQIAQSGIASMLIAFLFAQLAVATLAWGHATRLCGLVEIARALVASGAAPGPGPEPRAAPAGPAVTDDAAPVADPPRS